MLRFPPIVQHLGYRHIGQVQQHDRRWAAERGSGDNVDDGDRDCGSGRWGGRRLRPRPMGKRPAAAVGKKEEAAAAAVEKKQDPAAASPARMRRSGDRAPARMWLQYTWGGGGEASEVCARGGAKSSHPAVGTKSCGGE
ncbi:hypothetical protein OsI_37709 [Oryza sativa Indica Group]|uniref:Uncharacterized protein n=2 Tax=Oryza TaxID=4527 RepID=A0A0E0ILW4_ORYNI|nr:hypothetical protein OsI_37709 [Oryza sativa Indica Group]